MTTTDLAVVQAEVQEAAVTIKLALARKVYGPELPVIRDVADRLEALAFRLAEP